METILPYPFVPWVPATLSFSQAENKERAKAENMELCNQYNISWYIYTDRSLAEGQVAPGYAAKLPHRRDWFSSSYKRGPDSKFTIYEAELLGVYLALEWIEEELIPPVVFINSDSQAVLSEISLTKLIGLNERREKDFDVQLNWIPRHVDIYGNELADRTANEGWTRPTHRTMWSQLTLKTSYSAMRRRMRERYTASLKVEASKISDIKSNAAKTSAGRLTAAKTAKIFNELPRATRCLATQLRSGHYPTTKSYRYRFRLIDSPKCRACGTEDNISHRIFICRKHTMTRITLRRKITKINIRFDLGPILRNAHSIQVLYEFFKPQLNTYQRYFGGSV
ncbi:hypothetical protein E3P78_02424 [Wallemia ichthyophaga]|nr:hypothetical protein E3P78_02424 [Wallemia ichthyophaga]